MSQASKSQAAPEATATLSPGQLLKAQTHILVGPFGLPWLLERVADWGLEEPTWREGEPDLARAEKPPPPLQLLIPETVVFDKNGEAAALLFTDRGGFLRAVRKPLNKDPQGMYGTMLELMKRRQVQDLTAAKEWEQMLQANSSPHFVEEEGDVQTPSKSPPSPTAKKGLQPDSRTKKQGNHIKPPKSCVWRVLLKNDTEQRLTAEEVASRFGAATDGEVLRWPPGVRLLQVLFWMSSDSNQTGAGADCFYSYDATEQGIPGSVHTGLSDIVTNHFERFNYLDGVRNRNAMSALPNLLSQHLAYNCNLELLSGDFGFARDQRGQLWLAEARNLISIPIVSRGGAGKNGGPSGNEPLPHKLFRYMSEEALQNLPVDEKTGQKYQHMFEKMADHYQDMKRICKVDAVNHKAHEDTHGLTIPILVGTDRKALAKHFEMERPDNREEYKRRVAERERRLRIPVPKRQLCQVPVPGRSGRFLSPEATKLAKTLAARRNIGMQSAATNPKTKSEISSANQACEASEPERPQTAREAARVDVTQLDPQDGTSPSDPRSPPSSALSQRPRLPSKKTTAFSDVFEDYSPSRATSEARDLLVAPDGNSSRSPSKSSAAPRSFRRQLTAKVARGGPPASPPPKVEVVCSAITQKLLHRSGPGMRPEGPTFDLLAPPGVARVPGAGLTQRTEIQFPPPRMVVVPPGAAKEAAERVKARMSNVDDERPPMSSSQTPRGCARTRGKDKGNSKESVRRGSKD
eukprot:TRINITY_DN50519_c0_g1_i1.p1 TRINITY_DN50519_c0_g1~~TRINITY_DN50519_c0_g1_i1.p1  ORF type:complete len:747 (+),score=139.65 TRINITY_DN50519_c0_g1_i1:167-2407(+)